jgi:hypothetical protein
MVKADSENVRCIESAIAFERAVRLRELQSLTDDRSVRRFDVKDEPMNPDRAVKASPGGGTLTLVLTE